MPKVPFGLPRERVTHRGGSDPEGNWDGKWTPLSLLPRGPVRDGVPYSKVRAAHLTSPTISASGGHARLSGLSLMNHHFPDGSRAARLTISPSWVQTT